MFKYYKFLKEYIYESFKKILLLIFLFSLKSKNNKFVKLFK